MKKILLIAVALLANYCAVGQNITLPAIWGNGAVLKQNSEVVIRGWANPAAWISIVASWNTSDTIRVQTQGSGKFVAKIMTPAGSYQTQSITFNGKPLMEDLLIGEVWICSGQSNMQWSVNHGIMDGKKHALEADYKYIRLFNIPLCTAETIQEDLRAKWTETTPETMSNASAVGYFFGRELERVLGVPIGLIINAWGGAAAEGYTPSERVYGDVDLASNICGDVQIWRDDRVGKIYNSMVAPLMPYGVSGVIWYQGESNVPKWGVYDKLMGELVAGWREGFGQKLPFYMAQIAPFNYQNNQESAPLRIMQERASRTIENCGMIVISDLVDDVNNIHPTDKLSVGQRFAAIALAEVYGKEGGAYKYPLFKTMTVMKNGRVIVDFEDVVGGLKIKDGAKEIIGLQIVDRQDKIHNATGVIKGDKLEMSAKGVREVKSVWYCNDNTTIGNLTSGEGLPVAPFNSELNRK